MQECPQSCCDAATCTFRSKSECVSGECCNTTSCLLLNNTEICRANASECDLAEYCTSESPDCPVDVLLQTGSACNTFEGQPSICFEGRCMRTYLDQCEAHFCEFLFVLSVHFMRQKLPF